jgi:hypothetical protein
MASALIDVGVVDAFDNFEGVIVKVAEDLQAMQEGMDPAQAQGAPGVGIADQASPEEIQDVAQSGLTEKDIESAAKVVQVISEMKQKGDAAAGQLPPGAPGAQQAPQPPLPPPPQNPQGQAPAQAAQPAAGQPKTASERWGGYFRGQNRTR